MVQACVNSSPQKMLLIELWIIHQIKWIQELGSHLNIKTVFPGMGITMLKIRQSQDRLIFNMGISILLRQNLYIETAPI